MKLWIGAEISTDIAEPFREARRTVESAVNSLLAGRRYEFGLESWDCIAIVRGDDAFGERVRFNRAKGDMDFRLRIDHARFKRADARTRRLLIYEMLL